MLKRSILLIVAFLGMGLWVAPAATARTPYDGLWSVLIITDSGTCDRGYRYALRIDNGVVSYDDPSFNVSGHVAANGQVTVSVSNGGSRASGTGRLSRDSGGGMWSGHSSMQGCSGHWEAGRQ